MATHGYHGKTLDIDLSTGSSVSTVINEEVLRRHIGGSGLGVRLLLDREAQYHDPFYPKSTI